METQANNSLIEHVGLLGAYTRSLSLIDLQIQSAHQGEMGPKKNGFRDGLSFKGPAMRATFLCFKCLIEVIYGSSRGSAIIYQCLFHLHILGFWQRIFYGNETILWEYLMGFFVKSPVMARMSVDDK